MDGAFAVIEMAIDQRATRLWSVVVDPLFDFLKSDSRYDDLFRRMGLD